MGNEGQIETVVVDTPKKEGRVSDLPRYYVSDHHVNYATTCFYTTGPDEDTLSFGKVVPDIVHDVLRFAITTTVQMPRHSIVALHEMLTKVLEGEKGIL